ncbi:MAG: hypothetical protein NTX63_02010 [Candidatus Peregrinibacteria bacterium]|nr:hypothetical protein [Candidatus Peregrinibacteria bacterium]
MLSAKPELVLPEEREFSYKHAGFEFRGVKLDWKNDYLNGKYNVFVSSGSEAVGRFTFFTSDTYGSEIIFSGMFIEPALRSRGISGALMESLFRVAHASGREICHAWPQRKPLMGAILHKYGFEPVSLNKRELQETVYVGKGDTSAQTRLWFPVPAKAREFANSNIGKAQPYLIVDSLRQIHDAVRVVLNTDYVLTYPERAPQIR